MVLKIHSTINFVKKYSHIFFTFSSLLYSMDRTRITKCNCKNNFSKFQITKKFHKMRSKKRYIFVRKSNQNYKMYKRNFCSFIFTKINKNFVCRKLKPHKIKKCLETVHAVKLFIHTKIYRINKMK